jgi:hypothetical protein
MSAFLIAAKLFAGNALSAVWRFLKGASAWQLIALGLAAFALVQHFQLAGERRHSAKVEAQLAKATVQLQRISSVKNVQKRETANRIEHTRVIIKQADERAKVVETAPLPGNCVTPSLDTLRNVL